MNDFRQRDDSKDDHLHGLLTAIMDKEKKNQAKLDAHFISYRGMMTNVCTHFEQNFVSPAFALTALNSS